MNLNLSGKTALVGGSSQGLGAASAEALARQGASVILLARNEENLKQVLTKLDASKAQVHDYLVVDHSDPVSLKETVANYVKTKNKNIQILINNTGGPPPGPISEMSSTQILKAIQMHLIASHELAILLIPVMKKEGFGRIINITSTSVKEPIPDLGLSNTVRASVANWAKTLAMELANFGITVNNILPGSIFTGRLTRIMTAKAEKAGEKYETVVEKWMGSIPAGRFGEPSEIGNAVAFLSSPAAAYINGINFPVDGSRTKGL